MRNNSHRTPRISSLKDANNVRINQLIQEINIRFDGQVIGRASDLPYKRKCSIKKLFDQYLIELDEYELQHPELKNDDLYNRFDDEFTAKYLGCTERGGCTWEI